MFVLSILICAAAIFLGWALGPLGLKVAEKIRKSAEESEKKAKAGDDYMLPFHEQITPEYIDNHHFESKKKEPYIIFIPLVFALIFNTKFLWVLVAAVFLWIVWHEVVHELFSLIGFLFSFVFGGGEKKKK